VAFFWSAARRNHFAASTSSPDHALAEREDHAEVHQGRRKVLVRGLVEPLERLLGIPRHAEAFEVHQREAQLRVRIVRLRHLQNARVRAASQLLGLRFVLGDAVAEEVSHRQERLGQRVARRGSLAVKADGLGLVDHDARAGVVLAGLAESVRPGQRGARRGRFRRHCRSRQAEK
jgi:hypothetical protein